MHGKTTTSVNLHSEPKALKSNIIDSLEPNYPLLIRDRDDTGKWLYVGVPAIGKRTETQKGWIDARFVEIETKVDNPAPLLRPGEWQALIWFATIGGALGLLYWIFK